MCFPSHYLSHVVLNPSVKHSELPLCLKRVLHVKLPCFAALAGSVLWVSLATLWLGPLPIKSSWDPLCRLCLSKKNWRETSGKSQRVCVSKNVCWQTGRAGLTKMCFPWTSTKWLFHSFIWCKFFQCLFSRKSVLLLRGSFCRPWPPPFAS